jgi:hypothetical protein
MAVNPITKPVPNTDGMSIPYAIFAGTSAADPSAGLVTASPAKPYITHATITYMTTSKLFCMNSAGGKSLDASLISAMTFKKL